MFIVNEEEKTLYVTRGDVGCFSVSTEIEDGVKYKFQPGDVVRFKVTEKKACDKVVLSKDFGIEEETEEAIIYLEEKDTKIGGVISKPVEYWYEVELNPYTNPQTIIGYDEEDGAKIFKLFPEGADVSEEPITPEDIPVVDEELSLTSTRPVQNQAIYRAILKIREENAAEMARHGEFIDGKLSKVTEVEAELDRIAEETETKLARLDEFAEELERFDEIEAKLTKVDEHTEKLDEIAELGFEDITDSFATPISSSAFIKSATHIYKVGNAIHASLSMTTALFTGITDLFTINELYRPLSGLSHLMGFVYDGADMDVAAFKVNSADGVFSLEYPSLKDLDYSPVCIDVSFTYKFR